MDVIIVPVIRLLLTITDIYIWIVVAGVVLSWLVAYNVVNRSNQFVAMIGDLVYRLTEPLLRRIRRFMPDTGAFDLSPVVLIMGVWFVQWVLVQLLLRFV